jgi:hypothetical protein
MRDELTRRGQYRRIEVLVKAEHDFYREKWQKRFKSSQVNTLPKAKSQAKDKRAKDRQ